MGFSFEWLLNDTASCGGSFWFGYVWMGIGMILLMFMFLFILYLFGENRPLNRQGSRRQTSGSAIDILDRRYARGDISREEYQDKKAEILDRK